MRRISPCCGGWFATRHDGHSTDGVPDLFKGGALDSNCIMLAGRGHPAEKLWTFNKPNLKWHEMTEYVIRFIFGGFAVSAFAALGDICRPKSFAGIFGAAPSIAIATLSITFFKHGADYVAIEGRSMILGAFALALYSLASCQLLMRFKLSGLASAIPAIVVWIATAFGLCWVFFGES